MHRSSYALVAALLVAPLAARAQETTPPAAMPSVTLPKELDRVLRDYETAWRARDAAAVSRLFTEDGFVLQNGRAPVRGRSAIAAQYAVGIGGPLRLRALGWAAADTVGYIVGAYGYGEGENVADIGKWTLTLKRRAGGPWMIFSDMDNGSAPPRAPR